MKIERIENGIASLRISTDEFPYLDTGVVAELTGAVAQLEGDESLHAVLLEGGTRGVRRFGS